MQHSSEQPRGRPCPHDIPSRIPQPQIILLRGRKLNPHAPVCGHVNPERDGPAEQSPDRPSALPPERRSSDPQSYSPPCGPCRCFPRTVRKVRLHRRTAVTGSGSPECSISQRSLRTEPLFLHFTFRRPHPPGGSEHAVGPQTHPEGLSRVPLQLKINTVVPRKRRLADRNLQHRAPGRVPASPAFSRSKR